MVASVVIRNPKEGDGGGDPVEGEFPEGRVEPERHRLVKRHREQSCPGEGERLNTRRQHTGGKRIDGDGLDKDADRVAEPDREMHARPDPVPGEPEGEEQDDDDPVEEEVREDRPPIEMKDVHGEVREERDEGHHPAGCKRRPRREEDESKERERPGQVLVAHALVTEVEERRDRDDPGAPDVQVRKDDMDQHGECDDGGAAHVADIDVLNRDTGRGVVGGALAEIARKDVCRGYRPTLERDDDNREEDEVGHDRYDDRGYEGEPSSGPLFRHPCFSCNHSCTSSKSAGEVS